MLQGNNSSPSIGRKPSDSALSNSRQGNGGVKMTNGPVAGQSTAPLFTRKTKAVVWGMQSRAVQGMLDFDYSCSRSEPSVLAMVYPFVWVVQ